MQHVIYEPHFVVKNVHSDMRCKDGNFQHLQSPFMMKLVGIFFFMKFEDAFIMYYVQFLTFSFTYFICLEADLPWGYILIVFLSGLVAICRNPHLDCWCKC